MSGREFRGPAVVVDPYSSGALFAPAFAARGVPRVAVVSGPQPPAAYAASYRPQDWPETIVFDGDLEPVVARLLEIRPRCVIAGTETGVELAELLAPMVVPELSNVPELAAARRDKAVMAAAVATAGLATIPQVCTPDPAEVEAWLRREGLEGEDLVLKPPKSAGTDGVVKLPGGQGWRAAFERQIGQVNQLDLVNDRMLVQRYVEGTEYVVDTFSHDGRHTLVDVCRYHKVDNGGHMAIYDAMEWVSPDDPTVPGLLDYGFAVLDAVGVRFGPAHVEIMSTAEGPRLIELAARAHGGGQPRFCQAATGDSQVKRTVDYLTGHPVPDGFTLLHHQLVVFLIARRGGVVRNAEILDEMHSLPSHHFSVHHLVNGRRIPVTRDLFGSLGLGFAVLNHDSESRLWADYEALRHLEERLEIDGAPDQRGTVVSIGGAPTRPAG